MSAKDRALFFALVASTLRQIAAVPEKDLTIERVTATFADRFEAVPLLLDAFGESGLVAFGDALIDKRFRGLGVCSRERFEFIQSHLI